MYPPTNTFNKIQFITIIRTPTHMALEYHTQGELHIYLRLDTTNPQY
jgi:hypothetical protein